MADGAYGGVAVKTGLFWFCAAILIVLLHLSDVSAETPLPWNEGGELADGWVLSAIQRHPEYVRLGFTRNGQQVGVEIVSNDAGEGEWATQNYKVQPTEGDSPPETLLKAVLYSLKKWDSNADNKVFVGRISKDAEIKTGKPDSVFDLYDQIPVDLGRNPVSGVQTLPVFKRVFSFLFALLAFLIFLRIFASGLGKSLSLPVFRYRKIITIFIFLLVQIIPLVLVGFISFDVYESVQIVKSIEPDQVLADLKAVYASEKGMFFSLTRKDGQRGFYRFGWEPMKDDNLACTVPNKFESLERAAGEKALYIFGGSPVLLPDPENSMVDFVARDLSSRTGKKVNGYNFGMCGITSTSVAVRAIEALKIPPDLIIVYNGVNDYSYCNNFIARNYFIAREGTVFESMIHFFYSIRTDFFDVSAIGMTEEYAYPFFRQYFVEPVLNRIMRDVGFLKVDEKLFIAGENVMLEHYLEKMSSIVEAASESAVPVLIIPATGNLMERPFGINNEAVQHYVKALKSKDYFEKAYHLLWAREESYFNKLIRAKHPLYDALYNLEYPNLYVFDLEYELLRVRFPFNYTSYLDQAHMEVSTHAYLADFISDYIIKNDLCCKM